MIELAKEEFVMYYPSFLKKGDLIGISAPSAGVGHKLDLYEQSLSCLKEEGWQIRETEHVRVDDPRGGSAEERGHEFSSLFSDPDVDAVFCAAGGDFLSEILPYVNWSAIKKHPVWVAGASDPTSLLFTITAKYDIATLYGFNAGSFDENPLPDHLKTALKLLKGKPVIQRTSRLYSSKPSFAEDYAGLDTPTEWKSSRKTIRVSGRCIGGCIDVLKDLIGTPYETAKAFSKRYKEDGLIWYFDNFSLSAEVFYRTLLQMRYAGWFDHTNAVLIGRVLFSSSETGMSYEEAITRALGDIPVIYDADIGHTNPSFTMINGAILDLAYRSGKGSVSFRLE